jgi:hypothetical protein
MGRLVAREQKRVLREMTTRDGARLRVVGYRIPEPSYQNDGCGPRTTTQVHPDDLLEGLFSAALENCSFARALDALMPGVVSDIQSDSLLGLGVNGHAGAALSVLLLDAQQQGIVPMLIRATELRDDAAADRFISGWNDPQQRTEMAAAAALLLAPRDDCGDRELAAEFRRWGLSPRRLERKTMGGATISEPVSAARLQLRRIIDTSARIGKG